MMQYISKVPTMQKFLFLLDLRRGAIIAAIFGIVMCSLDAPNFVEYVKYFQNRHTQNYYENDPTMVFDFVAFVIALFGIAALSVVLLIGAYFKHTKLVGIYVVGMLFCLVLMLIVSIISLALPMFSFWGDLIVFVLFVYAWFTAHSLHQKLESGANLL